MLGFIFGFPLFWETSIILEFAHSTCELIACLMLLGNNYDKLAGISQFLRPFVRLSPFWVYLWGLPAFHDFMFSNFEGHFPTTPCGSSVGYTTSYSCFR